MSFDGYDRPSRSRRTVIGFWVPLIFTVTVATAGVAAWVWSERREDESDEDADLSYGEAGDIPPPRPARPGEDYGSHAKGAVHHEDETFMARMSGALRRTPSPQQLFDSAGKKFAAGIAATGAAMGSALAAIREEDKDDFGDHSRWSEEAAIRANVEAQSAQSTSAVATHTEAFSASMRGPTSTTRKLSGKRKTVAIVLSAEPNFESLHDYDHGKYRTENASLLSSLPQTSFDNTTLFVLIYAPASKSRPASSHRAQSLGSSYEAISTPGEELNSLDPHPESSGMHTPATTTPALSATNPDNALYTSMQAQALRLVEKPTMIMPFSTPTGHVHLLRHLEPSVVYMTESLAGDNGANVEQIKNWVSQVVVVVGDSGALGGLVDSDDEDSMKKEKSESRKKWWESADMVGLGKGVEIVDGVRFADDYERRVVGRE